MSGWRGAVHRLFGNKTFEVLVDKGYYQVQDLQKCTEKGITLYVTKQTYANGTKDQAFYSDQFKYNKTKNTYLCPAGKELHYYRDRKKDGKIIGHEYRNIKKYKLRQMIVEHPFGTIKRGWEAYFFLTKRKVSLVLRFPYHFWPTTLNGPSTFWEQKRYWED